MSEKRTVVLTPLPLAMGGGRAKYHFTSLRDDARSLSSSFIWSEGEQFVGWGQAAQTNQCPKNVVGGDYISAALVLKSAFFDAYCQFSTGVLGSILAA